MTDLRSSLKAVAVDGSDVVTVGVQAIHQSKGAVLLLQANRSTGAAVGASSEWDGHALVGPEPGTKFNSWSFAFGFTFGLSADGDSWNVSRLFVSHPGIIHNYLGLVELGKEWKQLPMRMAVNMNNYR